MLEESRFLVHIDCVRLAGDARLTSVSGDQMSRQIVFTPKAAKPPATYSQAVKAAGLVFISGTAPHDPATGAIKGTTIQEQTRQCLANVAAILEEAGSSLDKIVSATVVLADEEDFAGMNEEWLRWFPANPPARQGAKLPAKIPGLKVSIAAIAEA
jgi:2-iminobutanoate/2-iminopropanoate deaminase